MMIDLALLNLIRTTTPSGLWFNDCGVAQKVLRHSVCKKFYSYTIDLICINGIWGGCIKYMYCYKGNYGGMSGPVSEKSCRYTNVGDCITELVRRIHTGLRREVPDAVIETPKLEDFLECEPYNLPF